MFDKKENKASVEQELRKATKKMETILQEELIEKNKVQAKKTAMENELQKWKVLHFQYYIGMPLSQRLARFYVLINSPTNTIKFCDLAKLMNLEKYFAKLDGENKESVVQCPEYDSNYNKVN